jgi:hypothetical protein
MSRRFLRRGAQPSPPPLDVEPVLYEGRLVALAGDERCHVIDLSLSADEILLVAAMCLYVRQTRGVRPRGIAISDEAEAWARRYLER